MNERAVGLYRWLLVAAAGALTPLTVTPAAELPTYTATYELEYRGRRAGTSEFSVSYDATTDTYRFESQTTARGLYRLVAPNAIVEQSVFDVDNGRIRPLEFRFEDGSRRGNDNVRIVFDWDRRQARVEGSNGVHELDIRAGVLDRGSMQVALMLDMARAADSYEYLLADDDSVRPYRYVVTGEEQLTTAAGSFLTKTYRQQREGSSRATLIWAAPDLAYLPVRIERQRDGETQTALSLETIHGLEHR